MASSSVVSRPFHGEGRQALLDAAIKVVAASGLRNLTYRAVAERAGVTHGLVAHHFGSRDALIEAALLHSVSRNTEADLVPETGCVDDFAAGFVEMIDRNADDQAFQYELILESRRNPELRPHVTALYAAYREEIRTALVRIGLDGDDELAHIVFAALDGLTFAHVTRVEGTPDMAAGLGRLRAMLRAMLDAEPSPAGRREPR